jgi:hypothetical protein
MNNALAKNTTKTPLQIQKEKVASLRKAIAQAEALEELAQAEAELEQAELEAELQEQQGNSYGLIVDDVNSRNNSTEDSDGGQDQAPDEDENNDNDELPEPVIVTTKTRTPRSNHNAISTPARKNKVRTRTQERELESFGLPPHVSSWEISDSPENEENQIITFFAEGEAVTYIDVNPENLEDMMTALNSSILITGDNEVTGWSLRVPENPDIPPLLSLTANGAVLATLPLDETVLKQLLPKLESYYNPNKVTFASFMQWAKNHKFVSGFLGLVLVSTFLYAGYTALF